MKIGFKLSFLTETFDSLCFQGDIYSSEDFIGEEDLSRLFKLENFNFYQMQEDHLKKTIEKIKKELLQRKVLKD